LKIEFIGTISVISPVIVHPALKKFFGGKSGFYFHHAIIVPLMCVAGVSQDNHFARKSRALEKSLTRGMRFCSANALPLEIKSRERLF